MLTTHAQFFTATILEWRHLLKPDKYKDIIINSLRFLVANKRVMVYGFVIMPNHIHLLWHIQNNYKRENIQRDFLKFTAQHIKFDLKENHPKVLEKFKVNMKDRSYQFWEHRPLSVDLWTEKIFELKLDYIHHNPVKEKWKLAETPEDYFYSSARFYFLQGDDFEFLSHYKG